MYSTLSAIPTPVSFCDVTLTFIEFDVGSKSILNVGPCLSILFTYIVFSAIFPASSLTFITIPAVFWSYVFVFSACHDSPPSKLYACAWSPLSLSCAFTVNVTLWFVHSVGFPVTSNVGSTVSWIVAVAYPDVFTPSVNLPITISPFFSPVTVCVFPLAACHPDV